MFNVNKYLPFVWNNWKGKRPFIFSTGEAFKLNYFEMDSVKELDHLRNLVEVFILVSFNDRSYVKNSAIRSLLKEVILHKSEFFFNSNSNI